MDNVLLTEAIAAFVTLFVVIDPIGLGPMFVALTQGSSAAERRRIGIIAVSVAAGILTVFGLAGEAVLNFLGISMAAFRISGGLLLFMIAMDMVFERRVQRREQRASGEDAAPTHDPSVFPLATPLLAGPGAIATLILLIGNQQGDLAGQATVFAVLYALLLLAMVGFFLGGIIERLLGRTGVIVVSRLFGMLLAALSVQFVLDGLADFGVIAGH
ncbi:MAG TPA: MarC family protein [Thermohalobaculum sp.]|nr:MarC family protein [Thermohalobaculum sp.]